jgi:superfamily II DNA or RNA helicase
MQLHDYQQHMVGDIRAAWSAGARNVIGQLPTGGGKTVVMCHMIDAEPGICLAIAHRQELVSQISLTLGRYGIPHGVVTPDPVTRGIIAAHVDELGRNFIRPRSPRVYVASVDTLIRREPPWLRDVSMWVIDEGHHVLAGNKWGRAVDMLPVTSRGLLLTATPNRSDGKGLGRAHDGVADALILGPSQRELIRRGYLSEYSVVCATSDIELQDDDVTASGDYSPRALKAAAKNSRIVGDVVSEYVLRARGKPGLTFATDVETAEAIVRKYQAAGVPAEMLSAKTPGDVRRTIMSQFRARQILQIVNVDILGEGFDAPAVEVVSMARPTKSLSLYMQQLGRGLRVLEGKSLALIIDHVGNIAEHGLPDRADRHLDWTLEPTKGRRGSSDIRVCKSPDGPLGAGIPCLQPYEAYLTQCPVCGYAATAGRGSGAAARSEPAQVDGDLVELDARVLAKMRGDVTAFDGRTIESERARMSERGLPAKFIARNLKHFRADTDNQSALREQMALWGGLHTARGLSDREIQKLFYLTFGWDVLSAQVLKSAESTELKSRIETEIIKCSTTGASAGIYRRPQSPS